MFSHIDWETRNSGRRPSLELKSYDCSFFGRIGSLGVSEAWANLELCTVLFTDSDGSKSVLKSARALQMTNHSSLSVFETFDFE